MITPVVLTVYAAGALLGLAVMRDPWRPRLVTALAWPLGPVAFAVVISGLLVAAAVLWPVRILPVAAIVALLIWWLS